MCFLRQELRMPHEMNCATMRGARHLRIRARLSGGCCRESVPSDESLSRMSFRAAKFPSPTRSCLQRARSYCSKAAPPQLLSSSGPTFESERPRKTAVARSTARRAEADSFATGERDHDQVGTNGRPVQARRSTRSHVGAGPVLRRATKRLVRFNRSRAGAPEAAEQSPRDAAHRHSAMVGSLTDRTRETMFAGNPPRRACPCTTPSSGETYTRQRLSSVTSLRTHWVLGPVPCRTRVKHAETTVMRFPK